MPTDDRVYYLRRVREEEAAIRTATSLAARGRHEEMASSYRMRLQYSGRPDAEPSTGIILSDEPFIAASKAVPESSAPPPNKILVR